MILKNEFLSNKSIIIAGSTARLSIFLLRIHCRLKRQRDILEIYIYLPFAHIKMIVTLEKIQNIFHWIVFTPQLRVDFGRSLMTSNFVFWSKAACSIKSEWQSKMESVFILSLGYCYFHQDQIDVNRMDSDAHGNSVFVALKTSQQSKPRTFC